MPPLQSAMVELGSPAPHFNLTDTRTGDDVSLGDFAGRPALLVMFICNHCPFVKHVEPQLAAIGRDYLERGLGIVAISSNDPATHPEDAPERMRERAAELGYAFPYCFDGSQEVARLYGAVCTPDFFLYDAERRLAYRGQLDGSRPGNDEPVTGADLRAAIDAVLAGATPPEEQQPSVGCSIKWRDG